MGTQSSSLGPDRSNWMIQSVSQAASVDGQPINFAPPYAGAQPLSEDGEAVDTNPDAEIDQDFEEQQRYK